MVVLRGGLALSIGIGVASSGLANLVIFDPSLGTLPTAQGWTIVDSGGNPSPTISGGVLNVGPTSIASAQYWSAPGNVVDFVSPTSILAVVKIGSSNFLSNPGRAGFNLSIQSTNQFFNLLIASDRVALINSASGPAIASFSIDTTAQFRTYELRVESNVARVFVDGSQVMTAGTGTAISGSQIGWFGDGTSLAGYSGQIRRVEFRSVPEPVTMVTLSLGLVSLVRRRRSKG